MSSDPNNISTEISPYRSRGMIDTYCYKCVLRESQAKRWLLSKKQEKILYSLKEGCCGGVIF